MIGGGIVLIVIGLAAGLFGAWALSGPNGIFKTMWSGYFGYGYGWVLTCPGIVLLIIGLYFKRQPMHGRSTQ
jgi:hypothetical protein